MNALKDKVVIQIEAARDMLFEISRRIQANPEVAYNEFQAASWLSQLLETHGFVLQRGVGGLPTAFVASLAGRSAGPTIAFLAEYDALPEVGHGCGHNLIGTGAVGAAIGVAAAMAELAGTIKVIGTPAEEFTEGKAGKIRLLEAGVLSGVDACLMFHPWTESAVAQSDLGFMVLDIEFHGRPSHAAADPWNGLNALDGVLLTYNSVSALRQQLRPDARIHCIVTRGGTAVNVIPDLATARLMFRSPHGPYLEELCAKIENCAKGAALATGTEVEIKKVTHVKNSRFNPALYRIMNANMALLGEHLDTRDFWSASSDFGNVSQTLPALSALVKTHEAGIPWHSQAVSEAAISEQAHGGMLVAAKALAMSALDLLTEPDLLRKARTDFETA